MEDSREIKVDPMYMPEEILHDVNADAERYQKKLDAQEFEEHLDDCNYKFRDDVMQKVFMVKVNGTFPSPHNFRFDEDQQ